MRSLFLAGLLLFATEAVACAVCVGQPLKFAFQDSDLFFAGKVTKREAWQVTFEVTEQFHGAPVKEVTLKTSSSCSLTDFAPGQFYLVEATELDGGLHAYLCSHTQMLDENNKTLRVVRRRAAWWNSRWSRVSFYRFLRFIGRLGS